MTSRSPGSGTEATGEQPPVAAYLKRPAWAAVGAAAGAAAPDGDVVLSARARLARNLAAYPFPNRAQNNDLRCVGQEVRRAARADTERLADLSAISVAALNVRDRAELIDARRISPELSRGGLNRFALLDEGGLLSIFINEEDHIRIQALAAGNEPIGALRSAEDADARLARRLAYAVDTKRWGYLTTALTNFGTGLRLSVLAHLPALAFLKRLEETLEAAFSLGISIRGAHGEGSLAAGDLYQISNGVTFGLSTAQIAGRVRPVVDYLVAAERAARREIAEKHSSRALYAARDAWSRIEQAERLDAASALGMVSSLRLAAACGLSLFDGGAFAPTPAQFAILVAELRTGAGLTAPDVVGGTSPAAHSVRDAIQRPALIRTTLRRFYAAF